MPKTIKPTKAGERRVILGNTYIVESTGCMIWKGTKHSGGYGYYPLFGEQMVHRVVFMLTHGKIPNSYFICHRCDNPPCVNPDHLFLGSPKDNAQDALKKNRMKCGSSIYKSPKENRVILSR